MVRCIFSIRRLLSVLALFLLSVYAGAQERENTFQFGIGSVRQQDTYLSPLNYKGWQLSVFWMTERESGFVCQVEGHFSRTTPVSTTLARPVAYGGGLSFDAGWEHHWKPVKGLRVTLGALGGLYGGVLYNERNTNNPANARCNIRFSATVGARYSFRVGTMPLRLDYKADIPVIGVLFSPQYGQSYYDISKHGVGGCILPMWFGTGFNLRQQLALDIPLRTFSLRIAYVNDIRQQSANDIKWHDWGHSAMIGFVRRFTLIRNR